jgi:raffinose/stachyose/melibiose transport system permease protein
MTATTAPVAEAARGASSGGRSESERPPGEPRLVGYLYLLPAMVVFAVFVLYPLGEAVWLSFWNWDGIATSPATWAGFSNYSQVFSDEELRSAFAHAFILLIFYALLPLAIGLLLAGVIARARVRGLAFFRAVLFLPQVIAMVVVALIWKMIYDPSNGFLNRFLGWFGIEGKSWLGDFSLALPAVGLIGTYVYFGLAMVLLTAGVQKIPSSLYDAARVDGAGPFREFLAVTLPGLRGDIEGYN